MLNKWGRRSFIGRTLTSLVVVPLLWATSSEVASTDEAWSLVSMLNTMELSLRVHDGAYASEAKLRGALLEHARTPHDNPAKAAFLKKLRPDSDEILPGWLFDFALKTDGYVMVLKQTATKDPLAFVTDQRGVIYEGWVQNPWPTAESVSRAKEFPGVVSHDHFIEPNRGNGLSSKLLGYLNMVAPLVISRCQRNGYSAYDNCVNCGGSPYDDEAVNCPGNNNLPPPSGCCTCFNCGTETCTWCCFGSSLNCDQCSTCSSDLTGVCRCSCC